MSCGLSSARLAVCRAAVLKEVATSRREPLYSETSTSVTVGWNHIENIPCISTMLYTRKQDETI